MMTTWMTYLMIAMAVFTVVGYLAAIGVALQKWRSFERPSKFLLAGLLLLLFSWLTGAFLPMFFARMTTPAAIAGYVVFINGGQAILRLIALGLMVVAVYVDRKPDVGRPTEDFLPGDARSSGDDVNPFASPR